MSTLAGGDSGDSDIPDEEKTVFDWCKEGHVTKLESLVTDDSINSKDSQVYKDEWISLKVAVQLRINGKCTACRL